MRHWTKLAVVSGTLALPLSPATLHAADAPAAQPATQLNTLTEAEKAAGWKLLFDGKTLEGWRPYKKDKAMSGWKVVDGCLTRIDKGTGDIVTTDQYGSFELVLDWKIAPEGNSGVMYHVADGARGAAYSGPECQLEDDWHAHDPKLSGWCYGLYEPPIDPKTGKPLNTTKPAGEWNTLRILVDGSHVEHWMNGVKYLEYEWWSDDWKERVAKSKFAKEPNWGMAKTGYIALQDHNSEVAFRNVKVRVIEKK